MANKSMFLKPVAAAVGVAFVSTLLVSPAVLADDNPFSTSDLDAGYQLAGDPDKKKDKEGKCGEGQCGADKDKGKEGSCGENKDKEKGKEASCGADKEKGAEHACGADKEKGSESACGANV